MEKKNLNNVQENAAVTDEQLKQVAGGAQWMAYNPSGSNSYRNDRVRVINGKVCPKCGGNTGLVVPGKHVMPDVKCEKCDTIILENLSADSIEYLLSFTM